MGSFCKYCNEKIYWHIGHKRPFQDPDGQTTHICKQFPANGKINDHKLLTETITRVSELERKVEEISRRLNL